MKLPFKHLLTLIIPLVIAHGSLYGHNSQCCDPCQNDFLYSCGEHFQHADLPSNLYFNDLDNYNVLFGSKGHETKKLKFWGLLDTVYTYRKYDDRTVGVEDRHEDSNFISLRTRLGVEANLGKCWNGYVSMDIFSCKQVDSCSSCACDENKMGMYFSLDQAIIEKIYSNNSFKVGYKKANFGAEEAVEAQCLKTIERSVATVYFNNFRFNMAVPCNRHSIGGDSRLGLGNRHVGFFLDGEQECIGYGLAITNSFQGLGTSSQYANEIGIYGNIYYLGIANGIAYEIGFNSAYQPELNTQWLQSNLSNPVRSSILGWNPYAIIQWKRLYAMGELLGARVENGAINATDIFGNNAKPLGYNVLISYQITDCLEAVFRYSSLDTNHRGVRINNILPCITLNVICIATIPCVDNSDCSGATPFCAPALGVNGPTGCCDGPPPGILPGSTIQKADIFNKITSLYFGINYYVLNRAIKLSLGYQHVDFHGRWDGIQTATTPDTILGTFGRDKLKVDRVSGLIQLLF